MYKLYFYNLPGKQSKCQLLGKNAKTLLKIKFNYN